MKDADRHDQIESLATLKELLDRVQDDPDINGSDVRDAAIRAVNAFDESIRRHHLWRPYHGRGVEAKRGHARHLAEIGVEYHPEYPGRLRRRMAARTAQVAIATTGRQPGNLTEWTVKMRLDGPWTTIATVVGSFADAEIRGTRELGKLREPPRE